MKYTKTTISIPTHLKEEVIKLKNELGVSMNSICQTAIEEYLNQKDIEKLRAGALEMVDEYAKNTELLEWSNFEDDIIEYEIK